MIRSVANQEAELELTVDALAQRMGMTVRNLREWQSLGLLPPPTRRGRSGYYGPDHVARLERARELHADGFPLELVRRILDAADDDADLVGFAHTLRQPFQDEAAQAVEPPELARRFGVTDPAALERGLELGLLRRREDGGLEITNPRLAAVGAALIELGLPLDELLDLTERVRRHQEAVADVFIDVYRQRFWEPILREGQPDEGWAEIQGTLERLRPLALDAVVAIFKLAMDGAVETAIEEEARRLDDRPAFTA